MQHIHYLQHVPFEGPGCIAAWAQQKGYSLQGIRLYAGDPLPTVDETEMLVVMGGPMGVYEEDKYPWLKAEKQFLKSLILAEKKVLGICLGAQLIASVMGAAVYPHSRKEIGWFPVFPAKAAEPWWCSLLAPSPIVFHWHGDTFDLPAGAVLQASSEACPHQLYTLGKGAAGIQFHFEATPDSIGDMLRHGQDELIPAPFIQPASLIREQMHHCKAANDIMYRLLDRLFG